MHDEKYKVTKKKKIEEIEKKRKKEAKELENHYDGLNYAPHLDEN